MYGVPPPGLELGPHQAATPPATSSGGRTPPAGWPAKSDLDYVKTTIELLLLLLAVPWLVRRIVRNPKSTARAAADHHLS